MLRAPPSPVTILAPGLCELMRPTRDFVVVFDTSAPLVIRSAKGAVKVSTKIPVKKTASAKLDDRDVLRFLAGELDPVEASESGRISVEGDITALVELRALLT